MRNQIGQTRDFLNAGSVCTPDPTQAFIIRGQHSFYTGGFRGASMSDDDYDDEEDENEKTQIFLPGAHKPKPVAPAPAADAQTIQQKPQAPRAAAKPESKAVDYDITAGAGQGSEAKAKATPTAKATPKAKATATTTSNDSDHTDRQATCDTSGAAAEIVVGAHVVGRDRRTACRYWVSDFAIVPVRVVVVISIPDYAALHPGYGIRIKNRRPGLLCGGQNRRCTRPASSPRSGRRRTRGSWCLSVLRVRARRVRRRRTSKNRTPARH